MTTIVLLNRGGGSVGDEARSLIAKALGAAGVEAEVEPLDGGAIGERAEALAKAGTPLVIAAGGDGTLSAVAGALANSETAMGVLPLGTLNHLARDLGVPFELEQAAAIIAAGHRRRIDIAELNGRRFINNSAIGLYPLMVLDRDSQQKRLGRSKRLAMLVASFRTLWRFHDERLRLRVNGGDAEMLDTPLLFVGNNDYSVAFPAAGQRERLDDGRLCVMVMRKKGAVGLVAAMSRSLVGLTRPDDMVSLDDVTELRVDSRKTRMTVSIDGETCTFQTPLDYRILPAALTVIAPAAA